MGKQVKPRAGRSAARPVPIFDEPTVDRIVAEVDKAIVDGRGAVTFPRRGRPSLTGRREASPNVGFRITPEMRALAQSVADKQGVSVSALARQALEDLLRRAS